MKKLSYSEFKAGNAITLTRLNAFGETNYALKNLIHTFTCRMELIEEKYALGCSVGQDYIILMMQIIKFLDIYNIKI